MNKTKKYTLALLGFFATFLSACSQYNDPYKNGPKEINGHPVYEIPFEQPLIIDPQKEQVFYFKLNKKPKAPETNYVIYIMTMYPIDDNKYYDASKGLDTNDILIKNKMLQFEANLSHFDSNNIETKIGLSNEWIYYPDLLQYKNKNKNGTVPRFQSELTQFTADLASSIPPLRIFDNKKYGVHKNEMAYFLIQEEGGYYRLSIRSLKKFPDYPKLKLSVYISTERTPK